MKNSAWYQKLWEEKLKERPVTEEANAAWSDMKGLLDQQMPVEPSTGHPEGGTAATKSIASKVMSFITYVLPLAAVIYGALYFNAPDKSDKTKKEKVKIKDSLMLPQRSNVEEMQDIHDSVVPRTIATIEQADDPNLERRIYEPHTTPVIINKMTQLPGIEIPYSTLPTLIELQKDSAIQLFPYKKIIEVNRFSKKIRSLKVRKESVQKVKIKKEKLKEDLAIPNYSYGISSGVNIHKDPTLYFGLFGIVKVSKRITGKVALQLHTPRSFIGTYTHASYFRPDSTPAFTFTDSRKIAVLEVPLTLNYHITGNFTVIAGPVISFPIKQSAIKLGTIALPRDTLFNGDKVIGIITNTKPDKVNYGFKIGTGIQLKNVSIDVHYQMLTPYQFKNSLGTNKPSYNGIQLGISYKFNKK